MLVSDVVSSASAAVNLNLSKETIEPVPCFNQFSDLPPGARAALTVRDRVLASLVEEDLRRGLLTMALPERLASEILSALGEQSSGLARARQIVAPYRDSFYWHFKGRSDRLAAALKDALLDASKQVQGGNELFDWGTGDTQVAKRMQELVPHFKVSGGDIIPYYQGDPLVPFHKIINNSVAAISNNSQAVVTLCYVLHHEQESEKLLKEVSRMLTIGGRAIVVELTPCGENLTQRHIDTQRLWFSDFLFCDVWHKQDNIPMPGNYRTVCDWEMQAAKAGLVLISEKSIGGTPVIYADSANGRKLMVFQKEAL